MTLIAQGAQIDAKDSHGHTPLYTAAAAGHDDAVQALLKEGAKAKEALHHFAQQGDATAVKALLKAGAKAKEKNGQTLLHIAKDDTIVQLLLAKGANVNAKDNYKQTPLHTAVYQRRIATVKALIKAKAAISMADNKGFTPLHYATRRSDAATAQLLLDNNAAVNAKTKYWQQTPLHIAAEKGNNSIILALLAKEADIDAQDKEGHTPLYAAADAGHKDAVHALLNAGANAQDALYRAAKQGAINVLKELINAPGAQVNAKDTKGRRLLHYAKDDATAQLLLANNADINAKDKEGNTPLYTAAYAGHKDAVHALLNAGANAQDALYRAAREGDVIFLKAFISAGNAVEEKEGQHPWAAYAKAALELIEEKVDINAKDNYGYTPLHTAAKEGQTAKVWALIKKGANLEAKADGYTPLHWAAQNGHEAVAKLLIDNKANLEAKDKWEYTSLHLAAQNGHKDVAKLLRKHGGVE